MTDAVAQPQEAEVERREEVGIWAHLEQPDVVESTSSRHDLCFGLSSRGRVPGYRFLYTAVMKTTLDIDDELLARPRRCPLANARA